MTPFVESPAYGNEWSVSSRDSAIASARGWANIGRRHRPVSSAAVISGDLELFDDGLLYGSDSEGRHGSISPRRAGRCPPLQSGTSAARSIHPGISGSATKDVLRVPVIVCPDPELRENSHRFSSKFKSAISPNFLSVNRARA
jgi:hypothetical protein